MTQGIDLEQVRADTPGCADVAHFHNCGAALMPRTVLDTVTAHLALEARIGGYEAADEAAERVEAVYDSCARLIGANPHEIAIVENATRAWDMAFYSFELGPGDRILTAVSEYVSNYLAFLQVAERTGAAVEVVPNDARGQLDVAALAEMIDERVKLVAVTHVPTNGGLVNPAAAIGAVTRPAGIPFLLDACQSAGQVPIDVEAMGVDLLSATSRKYLRGPRGCGFLYVRDAWIERLRPPFVDLRAATWEAPDRYVLRADARRFENWERSIAGQLGMGTAVDYALTLGMDAIHARVLTLAHRLRAGLGKIKGVEVLDLGAEHCGIVSFRVAACAPGPLGTTLRAQGINIGTSGASSTRIDMDGRGLDELSRAAVHYYNSEEEVDRLLGAIDELAA